MIGFMASGTAKTAKTADFDIWGLPRVRMLTRQSSLTTTLNINSSKVIPLFSSLKFQYQKIK
jgi:hypothetical protein